MSAPVRGHDDSESPRSGEQGSPPTLVLVGTSFRSADIGSRERIARQISDTRAAELGFVGEGISESSLVETCNRLEVYLACHDPEQAARSVINRLSSEGLSGCFYVKSGVEAIRHIFRVAAGLDSPVLGEEQILDQVWEAGKTARVSGQARSVLSSLFDAAHSSGRRIRESYKVSSSNRSLSAFALRHALKELGRQPTNVLLIGSGEAAKLAALQLKGANVYILTGRRDTKVRFPDAVRISKAQLRKIAAKCDLIITATRHRGYVLRRRDLPDKKRTVVLDLGFPRNVDPALKGANFVRLYDLDDIASWAVSARRKDLAPAEKVVEDEALRFNAWLTASRLTPTLAAIYKWAEKVRNEETESALRRLQGLSVRERTVVEALTKRLTGKLMAPHATFVKETGRSGDQAERLQLLESIFNEGGR